MYLRYININPDLIDDNINKKQTTEKIPRNSFHTIASYLCAEASDKIGMGEKRIAGPCQNTRITCVCGGAVAALVFRNDFMCIARTSRCQR